MTKLITVLSSILAVAEESLSTKPGRAVLVPGLQSAWDDCCAGQLALRVSEVRFLQPMRGIRASVSDPPPGWAIHAGLEITRCIATVNDQGEAPSSEQVFEDGVNSLVDMQELHDALFCAVPKLPGVANLTLDKWVPVGASGGCAGGEWRFNFVWTCWEPCPIPETGAVP